MGDAMMAFWNAPLDDDRHAYNACLTALKMNEALVPVNDAIIARAKEQGLEPKTLSAGIGINTGLCSVGNMGSEQRFAYSALGDAVNLASRLEGQTKAYGVDVLVGEDTMMQANELAFIELDLIKVVGKEKPVKIFTLLGNEEMANSAAYKKWLGVHNKMMKAYRTGEFDNAAKGIKEAIKAANKIEQGLLGAYYEIYDARITACIKKPPQTVIDGTWDGVFVATSK